MDKVSELFARFQVVEPDSEEEEYDKIEIILELENLKDPGILPFFLQRVADADEYDLARIEILKIFGVRENQPEEYKLIAGAIQRILQTADDYLVKQWAARVSAVYVKDADLFNTILQVAADSDENDDVRHNVLSFIERKGYNSYSVKTLEIIALSAEDIASLKNAAQKLLREWKNNRLSK